MRTLLKIIPAILTAILISSCANQLPPQGGEIDRIPPKAVSIIPQNGTVNYTGNSFTIEFDKYVDRRSFRESLFISPKPKGDLDYSWSGKEVTVSFSKPLEKNKTYLVTIGKGLKDIRQGNTLNSPIIFAFSTGNIIDKGSVIGKVFNLSEKAVSPESYKNLLVSAYLADGKDINPEKSEPDFICPVNSDGSYEFSNLPQSKIRLFAVMDNDKNYIFNKDYDNISVNEGDIDLSDTAVRAVSNFLIDISPTYFYQSLTDIWGKSDIVFKGADNTFSKFISGIYKDSTGNFYSTVKNKDAGISVRPSIFLYFKNNKDKLPVTESISIIDTSAGKNVPLEYLWMNDSIIRVIPQQNLLYGTNYKLSAMNNQVYFQTIEQRKTGTFILKNAVKSDYDIYVYLLNSERGDVIYSLKLKKSENGEIKDMIAGTYRIFAFLDADGNGKYDRGAYYPFKPAEPFYLRDEVTIKGQWNTEDVIKGFF